ncbi:hypothetical protein BC332_21186 [Capsicum chinense]|nr:hypothetical protein BC332_21186 [Capsicum chinense]
MSYGAKPKKSAPKKHLLVNRKISEGPGPAQANDGPSLTVMVQGVKMVLDEITLEKILYIPIDEIRNGEIVELSFDDDYQYIRGPVSSHVYFLRDVVGQLYTAALFHSSVASLLCRCTMYNAGNTWSNGIPTRVVLQCAVISMISDRNGEGYPLILDGSTFEDIARAKFPCGLPYGLHGCWVPT